MKNTFGQALTVTIFGESHGPEIGATLDGVAPGIKIDYDYINLALDTRRPHGKISTARKEADEFRIISGVFKTAASLIGLIKRMLPFMPGFLFDILGAVLLFGFAKSVWDIVRS